MEQKRITIIFQPADDAKMVNTSPGGAPGGKLVPGSLLLNDNDNNNKVQGKDAIRKKSPLKKPRWEK